MSNSYLYFSPSKCHGQLFIIFVIDQKKNSRNRFYNDDKQLFNNFNASQKKWHTYLLVRRKLKQITITLTGKTRSFKFSCQKCDPFDIYLTVKKLHVNQFSLFLRILKRSKDSLIKIFTMTATFWTQFRLNCWKSIIVKSRKPVSSYEIMFNQSSLRLRSIWN